MTVEYNLGVFSRHRTGTAVSVIADRGLPLLIEYGSLEAVYGFVVNTVLIILRRRNCKVLISTLNCKLSHIAEHQHIVGLGRITGAQRRSSVTVSCRNPTVYVTPIRECVKVCRCRIIRRSTAVTAYVGGYSLLSVGESTAVSIENDRITEYGIVGLLGSTGGTADPSAALTGSRAVGLKPTDELGLCRTGDAVCRRILEGNGLVFVLS